MSHADKDEDPPLAAGETAKKKRGSPLRAYFLRRLGVSVGVILTIIIVNFIIIQLVPGDPVVALIGEYPAPPEYIAQIREDFGLDQPLPVQIWLYVSNLVQGDLGYSFASRAPVTEVVLSRLGNTLMLVVPSILLAAVIGVVLGVISATRKGEALDTGITAFTLLGYSIPVFWLGQVLVLLFAVKLNLLPTTGMYSLRAPSQGWGKAWDLLQHMILPVFCLLTFKIAIFARSARASVMGVLRSDFIMTAQAKGLGRSYILWRHILPNALIPVIAVFGIQFGYTLTSSILVENVFSWPGIGTLFVTSIERRDFPVLQAILLLSTIFVVLANLMSDVLYTLVDPRIRRSLGARNV